jgi:hypothetical protein
MKVKTELDRLGIENYIPMTYKVVDTDTDNPYRKFLDDESVVGSWRAC